MRRFWSMAAAGASWLLPASAAADDPSSKRLEVGLSLAYAAPIGDAERGGRVRDTTFGATPIALDAAYRLLPRIGIAARLQYGVGIPTLCQTASDCESSLGGDSIVLLGARFHLPRLGPLAPVADAGVGYEWLTTRLSDSGALSTRAYNGPILFWTWIDAAFRLGDRWTLGPAVGMTVGTFTTYSLETGARAFSGNVPARAVHAWIFFGPRLSLAW
jgi:hypothetical protein